MSQLASRWVEQPPSAARQDSRQYYAGNIPLTTHYLSQFNYLDQSLSLRSLIVLNLNQLNSTLAATLSTAFLPSTTILVIVTPTTLSLREEERGSRLTAPHSCCTAISASVQPADSARMRKPNADGCGWQMLPNVQELHVVTDKSVCGVSSSGTTLDSGYTASSIMILCVTTTWKPDK